MCVIKAHYEIKHKLNMRSSGNGIISVVHQRFTISPPLIIQNIDFV